MADNRKYYYLKLKESYFDDDAIVLLESMPDGILYSNILLKLYLKSLKNGGKLQLDENIPYTAQMIATLTRQQVGTVERALGIFQQLGLVEQLHGGLLYMTDIELMIGQSSTEAERKRAARLANKALPPPRTNGGHFSSSSALPSTPFWCRTSRLWMTSSTPSGLAWATRCCCASACSKRAALPSPCSMPTKARKECRLWPMSTSQRT